MSWNKIYYYRTISYKQQVYLNSTKTMSEKNLLLEYLKGRTLEEAKEICKDSKFILRVVREDGKSKIVTRDWKLNRLNLELENNIVKEVYIG